MPPASGRRKAGLKGLRVLVTTGPTREHLDPIRFMTNASSGRMGYALAAEAARRGARVSVVHGPASADAPAKVARVPVESALDMRREVRRLASTQDVVIGAAAVGDWRFEKTARSKIKRGANVLTARLVPNPDILGELGALRRAGKLPGLKVLAGFALETGRAAAHARAKLKRKGLDLIMANQPETLGSSKIRFTLLGADGSSRKYAADKDRAAAIILDRVEALLS